MGKIRVKTLGVEEIEKQQKNEAKKRQETKKVTKAPGLKGGQRVTVVGPTEEELNNMEEAIIAKPVEEKTAPAKKAKKEKFQQANKKVRSKRYQAVAEMVDAKKLYSLSEALSLLPKLHLASFDESVELHVNTTESGISGNVSLPHGTGKKIRIAIANDEILADVEKGKISFDILLATPQMMPKLAKVAKVLGPKGLMPNPKNGTITNNPEEAVKKFEQGQVRFKTETKLPVLHVAVGKLSFGEEKLTENIKVILDAIQTQKIKKLTLKSTMSPAIRVNISQS